MSATLRAVLIGALIFLVGAAAVGGVVAWADSSDSSSSPSSSVPADPAPATAAAEPAAPEASAAAEATAEAAAATVPDHTAHHTPVGSTAQGTLSSAQYDPVLPPVGPGTVHEYTIPLSDVTLEIAPGVTYTGWTFAGGSPGPVIHVREGDTVKVTLRNDGAIPHSIDFHAARIAPNKAFKDVAPGESFSFEFVAGDPGVFMYHCGTPPVLAHIANGMYGAIVVDPKEGLPPADRSYVLVASEWYLNGDGKAAPAGIDMEKARHMQPDYVTWNGYAGQYKDNPLEAEVGENVRFYVVSAGPSFDTAFHVVGTLLDRAYMDGTTNAQFQNLQTVSVPAGGGAVFDVHFDEDGLYPFVSHSFASVDLGQVGLVKVGDVEGTMSH
jgi:nitrite reductase (NO-forming)